MRARRVETTSRVLWSFICEGFLRNSADPVPRFFPVVLLLSVLKAMTVGDLCTDPTSALPNWRNLGNNNIGLGWDDQLRGSPSFTCWPYLSTSSSQVIREIPQTLSETPNQHTYTLRWVRDSISACVLFYVCVCSYPACLCECICTTSQRCWKRDFSAKHEVEFPYMPKHCQHSYVWIFLLKWMMCIWCLSSAESRGWCMWQQSVCSWWQYFSMLVSVALVMGTTETVYKWWTCRAWQAEYLSAWCFKTGFFVSQVLQSQIYHVECGRVGRRLGGNTLSLVCYASVKVAQRCCHAHTSHSGTTLGLRTFQL